MNRAFGFLVVLVAIVVTMCVMTPAQTFAATDYWWDSYGSTTAVAYSVSCGGSGSWNSTSTLWRKNTSNGKVATAGVMSNWVDGGNAIFAGTAGTVTLAGNITANGLIFRTDGDVIGSSTFTLTLSGNAWLDAESNVTATINNVLNGPINKLANIDTTHAGNSGATICTNAGTIVLTALNNGASANGVTVNAGTLRLDFSGQTSGSSNIINSGNALSLGGGTLNMKGAGNANTYSQTFSGTTLTDGTTSYVTVTNISGGSGGTLALGTISRANSGLIDFTSSDVIITASNTNANNGAYGGDSSILGYWATANTGNDFATNNGSNITVPTYNTADFTTGNVSASSSNQTVSGGGTTINSLLFKTDATSVTGGQISVASGAILEGSLVGGNAVSIANDVTTSNPSGLFINQTNTGASMTINGNVTGTPLTKLGAGNLIMTGSGSNPTNVTVLAGTLTNNTGTQLNLANGTVTGVLAGNSGYQKTTTGATTLNTSATYAGTTSVSAGTLQVGTGVTINNMTGLSVVGGTVGLGGSVLTLSTLQLGDTSSPGTILAGTGSITNSGTFDLRNGTYSYGLLGSGNIYKTTSGVVTLATAAASASSYTGTVYITDGTLGIVKDAFDCQTSIVVNGGTLVSTAVATTAYQLTVLSGGIAMSGAGGKLYVSTDVSIESGSVNCGLNGAVGVAGSPQNVIKSNTGIATLNGTWATLGKLDIRQGMIQVGGTGALTGFANGIQMGDASTPNGANVDFRIGSGQTETTPITITSNPAVYSIGQWAAGTVSTINGAITTNSNFAFGGTLAVKIGGGVTEGTSGQTNTVTFNNTSTTTIQTNPIADGSAGGYLAVNVTAGTANFNVANTYTGSTTVQGGTLNLNAALTNCTSYSLTGGQVNDCVTDAMPTSTNLTLAGSTLALSNDQHVAGFHMTSGTVAGTGSLVLASGNFDLQSGTVTGILAGSVGMTKSGAGTVTLKGVSNSSYTGTSTIANGRLFWGDCVTSGANSPFGNSTGAVVMQSDAPGNVLTLVGGAANNSYEFDRPIHVMSDAGSYNIGSISQSSSSQYYFGTITLDHDVTLVSVQTTQTSKLHFGDITAGTSGLKTITIGPGPLTGGTGGGIQLDCAITDGAGQIGLLVDQSAATGVGKVSMNSASNAYSGNTDIRTGGLQLGINNAIPNTTLVIIEPNGTLALNGFNDCTTISLRGGTISGNGTLTQDSGSFDLQSGLVASQLGGTTGLSKTTSGTVTITTAVQPYTGATSVAGGLLRLNVNASGTSGFTITNGARLDLAAVQSSTSYSLTNGTLGIEVANPIPFSTGLTLGSNAILAADFNVHVGSLSLTGGAVTGSSTVMLTNGGNFDVQSGYITAKLADNGLFTTAGLSKTTSGVVTLYGVNTYTGTTSISGGTLYLASTGALGTGGVNVTNGAQFTADGTVGGAVTVSGSQFTLDGTVNNSVSLDTGSTLNGNGTITGTLSLVGSTLSPGHSPGSIQANSLTMDAASTFAVELGLGSYDNAIILTGNANLGGATLQLTELAGFVYTVGQQFWIIDSDCGTTSAVVGQFAQGSTITVGTDVFTISYNVAGDPLGSGYDVLLTAGGGSIPEPATLLLLGTSALGAFGWLRRRNMK